MLDDLANEIEMEIITDSKMDSLGKRVAKALHMNNGNYNNYIPAPTNSALNTSDYNAKPSSFCFLSSTISNCFLCPKE